MQVSEAHLLPRSPVALNKSPFAVDDHRIPRIGEFPLANAHSRLVAHALRMSFDIHTVQRSKAKPNVAVHIRPIRSLLLPTCTGA